VTDVPHHWRTGLCGTGIDTTVPHRPGSGTTVGRPRTTTPSTARPAMRTRRSSPASPWSRAPRGIPHRASGTCRRGRDAAVLDTAPPAPRTTRTIGQSVGAGIAHRSTWTKATSRSPVLGARPALLSSAPRLCDYLDAEHQEPRGHPGDRRGPARFLPARRAHADGDHGPLHRRRGLPDRQPLQGRTPSGSYFALYDGASPTMRSTWRSRVTTKRARCPITCAARSSSGGTSRPGPVEPASYRWCSGGGTRTRTGEIYSYCGVGPQA